VLALLLSAPTSVLATGNEKLNWIKGCETMAEKKFTFLYNTSADSKLAADIDSPGNYLTVGMPKRAQKTCSALRTAMVENFGENTWAQSPNTEVEGCWYSEWAAITARSLMGVPMNDPAKKRDYIDWCGSVPSKEWLEKWDQRSNEFSARLLQQNPQGN